jgi:hypothetical protein
LEVTLLEGKLLLSPATVHDSLPHAVPCIGNHFLNLNGRIAGYLTPVGSTLQIVLAAGRLQDYGKANASGTFTLTPESKISSGQIVLSSRAGSINLAFVETKRSPLRQSGQPDLRLAAGHGTGAFANHCSNGSVHVALHANRSHFVAELMTTTQVRFLPAGYPLL